MSEYSKLASGSFVTAASQYQVVNLPFVPDQVEVWNLTGINHPGNAITAYAMWNSYMTQGDASGWRTNSANALSALNYFPTGISTFSGGLSNQLGLPIGIASIDKAGPALVTTTSPHGYQVGNVILMNGITGMNQIAGIPIVILSVPSTTSFTILWNTGVSNYTAISGSPTGAYVRQVLYPYLYSPGQLIIEAVVQGTTTEIITSIPHNFVVGQEVAFHIPPAWGITQLNSLSNGALTGAPNYAYVTQILTPTAFIVNVNSTAFTSYTLNVVYAPGLQYAQVCAVGDVNTGGWPVYAGSSLYPPPMVNGVNTVNGPAIQGAFVNNTSQGFIIGPGILTNVGGAVYWEAKLHDISSGVNFASAP